MSKENVDFLRKDFKFYPLTELTISEKIPKKVPNRMTKSLKKSKNLENKISKIPKIPKIPNIF